MVLDCFNEKGKCLKHHYTMDEILKVITDAKADERERIAERLNEADFGDSYVEGKIVT